MKRFWVSNLSFWRVAKGKSGPFLLTSRPSYGLRRATSGWTWPRSISTLFTPLYHGKKTRIAPKLHPRQTLSWSSSPKPQLDSTSSSYHKRLALSQMQSTFLIQTTRPNKLRCMCSSKRTESMCTLIKPTLKWSFAGMTCKLTQITHRHGRAWRTLTQLRQFLRLLINLTNLNRQATRPETSNLNF